MRLTMKTAILFAAIVLVSAVTAITVFAQPSAPGHSKGHLRPFVENMSESPEDRNESAEGLQIRPFVEPILRGQEYALQGDQYHILDVDAIKTSDSTQMATKTVSHLRFAGQAYALNITGYDNKSLTGDVLTLPPRGTNQTDFTPATIGHISLSISNYEGALVSTGTLSMNNTVYNVLLKSPVMPSRGEMFGMGGYGNGTHGMGGFGGSGPRNNNGTLGRMFGGSKMGMNDSRW